jgi:hypothetical protein
MSKQNIDAIVQSHVGNFKGDQVSMVSELSDEIKRLSGRG